MNEIGQLVKSLGFIEEFVATAASLATERDGQQLLRRILTSARRFTQCEAGRIYVLDVTRRVLQLCVSQWRDQEPPTDWYCPRDFGWANGLDARDPLMHCGVTGAVVLIEDVYSHAGFDLQYLMQHDLQSGTRTRSLMLVPLRDHEGQTIGILELVNARDADDRRTVSFKPLEAVIRAFAAQAAVCINNAQLIEANRQLIGLLNETNQRLETENRQLKARAARSQDYRIIGASEPMQAVFGLMDKAVSNAVTVLLTGETGTGKEVFAQAIHEHGPRRQQRFVSQNCAALPEQLLESELFGYRRGAFSGAVADKKGLFELADGGTLFLDEIGDMPLNLQSKLLRVLQEGEIRPLGGTETRKINVRVIAATHCDLQDKIRSGQFREDLFYRLNVFPIGLPPLRERGGDLGALLDHFLQRFRRQYQKKISGFSPAARQLLLVHDYPGNVRELQNLVERAVLLCEEAGAILPEHLPESLVRRRASSDTRLAERLTDWQAAGVNPQREASRPMLTSSVPASTSLRQAVSAFEVAVIEQHLQASNWNQTRAAASLQIPRRTLIDKMSRFNIRTPERKR